MHKRISRHGGVLSQLRTKFIVLNMACIATVVTLAFSAICYFYYSNETNEVFQSLSASIDAAAQAAQHNAKKVEPVPAGQENAGSDALAKEGSGFDSAEPAGVDKAENSVTSPAGSSQQGQSGGSEARNSSTPDISYSTDEAVTSGGALEDIVSSDEAGVDSELATVDTPVQAEAGSGPAAPEIGGGRGQSIPIAVYSLSGDAVSPTASPFGTASIDEEVLTAATERLLDEVEGTGEISDLGLLYEKRTQGDMTYLAFADVASASGWKSLAAMLALVGIGAIGAFLVISILFSRWALRPTEQAWRSQRQFIADASHELKTPLTVILADASIALGHPDDTVGSQRQWIEGIQREGYRMQRLVEDMLALAKHDAAESGALEAPLKQREPIDLSEMAQRAVLQFEAVAFERGVLIEDRCEPDVRIDGVSDDIERVLGVLVDNACKYADEGGRVWVETELEGRHALLRVGNSGTPISEGELPHVFDRFWRSDDVRTGGKGGYGLGLSIARSIVEEHGGTLVVESSADSGTVFTAVFPARRRVA